MPASRVNLSMSEDYGIFLSIHFKEKLFSINTNKWDKGPDLSRTLVPRIKDHSLLNFRLVHDTESAPLKVVY
jgi:hypothetical protein